MLYTRKGDNGTTKSFDCDQRFSKSSVIAEALGSLDEVNSFIGLVKIKSADITWLVGSERLDDVVAWIQNCLFSVQAEVAGASKKVGQEKVLQMEGWIDGIEKELPPIKTFFISGGTELAALFDISRTLARNAERRVVAVVDEGRVKIDPATLAFLNRLSSLFYALARLTNHKSGITEQPPTYK